jgi:cytochrome c oxidase assembly protein subunit 15
MRIKSVGFIVYINRLIGVLVGIFIFLTLVASWPLRKTHSGVFALSIWGFIGVAFEGWLGSIVVSTNLLPLLITIHMLVAMLVLVVLILAYMKTINTDQSVKVPSWLGGFGVFMAVLALIQIILGTQVREAVDVVARQMGTAERTNWISNLGTYYAIHVRFYWLLIVGLLIWNYQLHPFISTLKKVRNAQNLLALLLLSEIALGLCMHYFAIPPIAQPMHLMLGTSIFCLIFYISSLLFSHSKSA